MTLKQVFFHLEVERAMRLLTDSRYLIDVRDMHGQANKTRSTRGDSQLMQVVQGRLSRRKEKVQDLSCKETSRQAPAWFKGKPPLRA